MSSALQVRGNQRIFAQNCRTDSIMKTFSLRHALQDGVGCAEIFLRVLFVTASEKTADVSFLSKNKE